MKKIEFKKIDDIDIITPVGELTFNNIEDLNNFIKERIKKNKFKIIYNMVSVTWIDSLGLGLIAKSVKQALINNSRVCLVKPRENILQLFKLCSLINLVEVFDSVEQSVEYLNS